MISQNTNIENKGRDCNLAKIKCPSTDELIYIHTLTRKMEFHSVIKKIDEILPFRATRMNSEGLR